MPVLPRVKEERGLFFELVLVGMGVRIFPVLGMTYTFFSSQLCRSKDSGRRVAGMELGVAILSHSLVIGLVRKGDTH